MPDRNEDEKADEEVEAQNNKVQHRLPPLCPLWLSCLLHVRVAHAAAPHYVQAGGSGTGPYSTVGRMYGGSVWQEPALPGLIRSGDALGWPDNRRRELQAPPAAVLPMSPCHHRLRQVGHAEPKPCSEPRVTQRIYLGSATACFLTNCYTGKTGVNDSVTFSRPAVT